MLKVNHLLFSFSSYETKISNFSRNKALQYISLKAIKILIMVVFQIYVVLTPEYNKLTNVEKIRDISITYGNELSGLFWAWRGIRALPWDLIHWWSLTWWFTGWRRRPPSEWWFYKKGFNPTELMVIQAIEMHSQTRVFHTFRHCISKRKSFE